MTACIACGTAAPTAPPPYTWSVSIHGTTRSWTCVPCSREYLAHIEGRDTTAR